MTKKELEKENKRLQQELDTLKIQIDSTCEFAETRIGQLEEKIEFERKNTIEFLKNTIEIHPAESEFLDNLETSTEKETLHSARLREAGISNDYYENGDEFDEGDSSHDEHYGY